MDFISRLSVTCVASSRTATAPGGTALIVGLLGRLAMPAMDAPPKRNARRDMTTERCSGMAVPLLDDHEQGPLGNQADEPERSRATEVPCAPPQAAGHRNRAEHQSIDHRVARRPAVGDE